MSSAEYFERRKKQAAEVVARQLIDLAILELHEMHNNDNDNDVVVTDVAIIEHAMQRAEMSVVDAFEGLEEAMKGHIWPRV